MVSAVAMSRSLGLPSRIAVGLAYVRGAFYYHAWPEVYVEERGRALWLPVDPTLNQFPADATHLRLARGGLDRQAVMLPLIGKLEMSDVRVTLAPGATLSLSANRDGSQTIAGVPQVEISRREHRRIEYANYAGLVRGAWADRRDERRRRS